MPGPSGTTDAALTLLARARSADEVRVAIEAAAPGPRLREAILARYGELAAAPKRDPGAFLRSELIRGLRPLLTVADAPLLERAVLTYEFRSPGPEGENADRLRSAALLALGDLDPDRADVYATHLLGDGFTQRMSGEPALTAIAYLAGRDALLPVYLFALGAKASQEVLAAALRSLAGLPAPLVLRLADAVGAGEDEIALLGLFDLIVAHDEPAAFSAFVSTFARETQRLDVLDFAAAEIVARRREPLIAALREARDLTTDRARRAILDQALAR